MFDEGHDPALVEKVLFLGRLLPLVLERDRQALVQEGELAQPLGQHVEAEVERFEDLPVRLEPDFRAAPLGFPGALERRIGLAALVSLFEHLAVLPDFQFEPFGQRIDDRDADAVETARNGVGALFELAAGVQHGERHFRGGLLLRGVHAGRNAAPVVDDGHAAVDMDRDLDRLAEAGHVFVDAVVDDFVDQMVQSVHAGAADVHRRPLPHRIETLEDFDLIRAVAVGFGLGDRVVCGHSVP